MGNKTISAAKLQEVITAKTMGSITGVSAEAPKTSKKAEPKKNNKPAPAARGKETKKVETKTPQKEKKAATPREVKYIYPADCTGSLDKKKFRAEFRAHVHSLEAKLEKAKEGTKEYKAISKELKEYRAQYLRG